MNMFARSLITTLLTLGGVVGVQVAAAEQDVPDQCPTVDGYQPVDICVPSSKPKAWVRATCATKTIGKARVRLKNNGDLWDTFTISGAGADKIVDLPAGEAVTIRLTGLTVGRVVKVIPHSGYVIARDRVELRPRCR